MVIRVPAEPVAFARSYRRICGGSHQNRSICICPINTFGSRCLLQHSCETNFCENGGQCILNDLERAADDFVCICPAQFHGFLCEYPKTILRITFENMKRPSYVSLDIIYRPLGSDHNSKFTSMMVAQKLRMFQTSVTFYLNEEFQIVVAQADTKYYLVYLHASMRVKNVSTSLSPAQQCPMFREIASASLAQMPLIRRVKYYHQMCRQRPNLKCFVDDSYFCLCTTQQHASCIWVERNYRCHEDIHCQNGAECFQDEYDCPTMIFCVCSDCFYGSRCQFYAKGIGLTLDDMLRYEIRPLISFDQQPITVKITGAVATVMFVTGLINGILSLLTFYSPGSRVVGAGLYLLASSITSLVTVSIFNARVWFLIITQTTSSVSESVLRAGCRVWEPALKISLFTDNWLNVCVAIDRAMMVQKGVNFDQRMSKRVARWVMCLLPFVIAISIMHEFLYRDIFDDQEEQRIWCVLRYSPTIGSYSTFILSFHTVAPLLVNLFSAIFIIIRSARRKSGYKDQQSYKKHIREQLKEHRHLIVSPLILTVLSLPRAIISLMSRCVKAHRNPWLYLSGYFISFVPSVSIYLVFISPSAHYREQFAMSRKLLTRNIINGNLFSRR